MRAVTRTRSPRAARSLNLFQQVRHLPLGGMHDDFRVHQPRRADHLLDDFAAGFFKLKFAGRGRDENHLVPHLFEFLELQGAIIERAGKAEAMLDQHLLALAVAVVHRVDLRHGHVRFVDDQHEILREIVDQRVRFFAGLAAVEVAAVVFDPAAIADFQDHLQVVLGSRQQSLGFEELALAAQVHHLLVELFADRLDGALDALFGHDVVDGGVDEDLRLAVQHLAGERIDSFDGGDLIPEHFDPVGEFLVGGVELDHVAADAESGALKVDVVAGVLEVDELVEHGVAVGGFTDSDRKDGGLVVGGGAEAEDAGDGGDEQHVVAAHEVAGGGQAQAVEIVIAARVFLDVDVALGDVGFGLVVVVVADEIADSVVGKEILEFLVKLGGEGFVVGDDECGPVHTGDGVGHGEGLAGAGDAHEGLEGLAALNAGGELVDGLWLIALGLIGADDFEVGHMGGL